MSMSYVAVYTALAWLQHNTAMYTHFIWLDARFYMYHSNHSNHVSDVPGYIRSHWNKEKRIDYGVCLDTPFGVSDLS